MFCLLIDVPETKYYHYDLGTSEYKMKFKEWPMGEHPMDHSSTSGQNANTAAPSSRVFPSSAANSYADLRQHSSYHESYPAYELNVMSAAAPKVDGRANESNKPPAFAWSLVDGEKPSIPQEHHDPAVSQMGESEYTRKYHWPTAEDFAPPQQRGGSGRSQGNPDSMAATLFPTENVSQRVEPILSEYRQQFNEKDIFGNARAVASPNRSSQAPKQFAWALEQGSNFDANSDDENVKARRPRPVTSDLSEHTNKYKWPLGTEPIHLMRKPDESHELKVGKVYALDEDQRDSRNWASEYDEKYTKLRQRQKELAAAAAAANGHIAGVPSASHPSIPSNFAWKETDVDKPRSSPVRSPKHVSPEHFHTEYEDKFLAWKNEQATTSAKRTDDDATMSSTASKLNLFEAKPYANGPAGTKSEYEDRFRLPVPGSGDSTQPFSNMMGKADSGAPPQFAWPLMDESLPRPAPVPAKPSKPLEKSEYESKFLWPSGFDAAKSFKPLQDSKGVSTAPMATEEDATPAGWKTEAQEPNHPTKVKKSKEPERPAGLVHVRDEDVPSFFAWADAEEHKVPVMPPRPPEQPLEVVHSEAQSEYRGHSPATAPPAKICRPSSTKNAAILSDGMEKSDEIVSEYQANFSSSQEAKSDSKTIVAGVATSEAVYRPPQFAWPRVDPHVPPSVDTSKCASDKERKFSDSTEQGSKYIWPAADLSRAHSRFSSKAQSSFDHFEGSVTLLQEPGQARASDWCSEYDARCAETQQKQRRAASAPPAMRGAARANQAPPFFVWSASDAAAVLPPPAPLPKPAREYHTETSEYHDQFISWQEFASEDETSNLRGTQKARPAQKDDVAALLCDPPMESAGLGKTGMKSEYEAQFTEENGHASEDHKIVTYRDVQRTTLPCTNLDKYTPYMPAPSPYVKKPNPNAAMQFRTEYSDHFTWQAQAPKQPENESGVHAPSSPSKKKKNPTQKMKANSVAAKQSIPYRSDANKENAGSTLQSTTPHTPAIASGTTEYRRQFSWPDAARRPNDIEVEREGADHNKAIHSEAQHRQKLAEQRKKYHLMSKNGTMLALAGGRDNHFRTQLYKDGKDHTSIRSATFGRAERFPGGSVKKPELTHVDVEDANESGGALYRSTLISQDSLNVPATPSQRPSTTSTATSTGTVVTESECASMNQPSSSTSSSSAGRPAFNKVMPSSPISVSTNPSSPPVSAVAATAGHVHVKEPAYISGLRNFDPPYRARSASPRQVVGSSYADSTAIRTGLYTDQTPSNPVLMNRRYPSVSDRQRTRWSTETRDSFAWVPTNKFGRGVRSLS